MSASDPPPAQDPRILAFAAEGFLGPLRIFTPAECRRIAAYLHREHPAPADWVKGRAIHERFLYELATTPAILSLLTPLLGEDIVLWGAQAVSRAPGGTHSWHTDIESSQPDGRFVAVWIGVEHTCRESALQVISHSHRLSKTVQEARLERGLRRDLATAETMLAAAREREPKAALVQPDMTNGDALFIDGRLWHGAVNSRKRGKRLALLFQYAAAESAVWIPDLKQLEWPFRLRTTPRPPVIAVSGTTRLGVNKVVPAPPPTSWGQPMVTTVVHKFTLPLDNPAKPWEAFHAFRGPTRTFANLSCHASVLTGGHSPHPPHVHPEEELLIPLHGQVELRIANAPDDPAPRIEHIGPGSFVYYPNWQHHTIRNPGTSPVAYLMFKWEGSGSETPPRLRSETLPRLDTRVFHYGDVQAPAGARPFWTQRLFQDPTSHLGRLHSHLTVLEPGAGYEPHVDAYDVAIVLLSGTVETLNQVVEPLSVIFYSAGEPHGMKNVGTESARYLVFEFHAPGTDVLRPPPPLHRRLLGRVIRIGKRLARPLWHLLERVFFRSERGEK